MGCFWKATATRAAAADYSGWWPWNFESSSAGAKDFSNYWTSAIDGKIWSPSSDF
jgi:hypothetical protein